MTTYLIRRLLLVIPTVFFAISFLFLLFFVLPGDPARTLGRGRFTTEEQLEAFSRTYGLDQSLPQQAAVPAEGTASKETGTSVAPVSVTVKTTFCVPAFPSVTV